MQDKQKALNLIEQSLLRFKELGEENPPLDYLEWNDRQHAAGKPLDEAQTLWMNMKGRDQARVRDAWAGAHVQIERMLAAEGSADEASDEKYQPVETHGVESASSDRRKALELIEAAFQGYRSLLERPAQHDEDYRERKGKADAQQAAADIIMRGMLEDYRTVVDAFGHANYEIEVMAGKLGDPGQDVDEFMKATKYLDFRRMGEVDEDEPEDVLDVDDRAESTRSDKQEAHESRMDGKEPDDAPDQDGRAYMYSTQVHDPFDGEPDDSDHPENEG